MSHRQPYIEPESNQTERMDPAVTVLVNVAVGISFLICGCLIFAWIAVGALSLILWPLSL